MLMFLKLMFFLYIYVLELIFWVWLKIIYNFHFVFLSKFDNLKILEQMDGVSGWL